MSKLSRLARIGHLTGRVASSMVGQKLVSIFQDSEVARKAEEKLCV